MVVGGALIVFSCGGAAQFGMGLINEGVSDLITAVRAGIRGEFSWTEWGIQKAISLAISIVTAGIGAVKEAAKATGTFIKTAAVKAKELAMKQILNNTTKQVLSETTKQGLKLAAKQIGLALAKGAAKEIINQVSDHLMDKTVLSSLREQIEQQVEKSITDVSYFKKSAIQGFYSNFICDF